jgi:sterol desaturase/sphingolipid hydroxylase (fatty acid hydroxylase superfamily)
MHFIYYYLTVIISYWFGSIITLLLDLFNYRKINRMPKKEIVGVYLKILPNVLFNLHIVSFMFFFLVYPLFNVLKLHFSIWKMAFDILFSYLTIDFFFYISHRLMHTKLLYEWSHKTHHELKNPVGFGTFYAHWFDFIVCIILPTLYSQFLLSSHAYTSFLWIIITITNSIFVSHGGYDIKDKLHYYHHKTFIYNYGTGLYMDKLFRTEKCNTPA